MYDPLQSAFDVSSFLLIKKKVNWVAAGKSIHWHIAFRRPTHVRIFTIGTQYMTRIFIWKRNTFWIKTYLHSFSQYLVFFLSSGNSSQLICLSWFSCGCHIHGAECKIGWHTLTCCFLALVWPQDTRGGKIKAHILLLFEAYRLADGRGREEEGNVLIHAWRRTSFFKADFKGTLTRVTLNIAMTLLERQCGLMSSARNTKGTLLLP